MSDNYSIWGDVDVITVTYKIMGINGQFESRDIVQKALIAWARFFSEQGLFTISVFDMNGNLINRNYIKSDFTPEGVELLRIQGQKWIRSKNAKKCPPNIKSLQEALDHIRKYANINYLRWGAIDKAVSICSTLDKSGNIIPDLEYQKRLRRVLSARIKFYSDHGLLTIQAFDKKGVLIDRDYYKNDFTLEGLELSKRKDGAWLSSKGADKDPPDMKLLEKELAEIRAGR